MTTSFALIVDDEPDIRDLLAITLGRMGIVADTVATVTEAREHLAGNSYQLCLTDMNLPDGNGIELVRWIQKHYPQVPVAVITAYGSMDTAISALKAGAFDFVSKPVELARLRELVASALKLSESVGPRAHLRTMMVGRPARQITGNPAPAGQIRKLARSQAPIYISGESGSGKELVARMIHEQGPRRERAFVPVNCGAIPAELMESEFFGHRKGSFTGATENKEGLFRSAHGGTLFLDEVADLPLPMQVKLLRAIQEKAVRPVGESQEIPGRCTRILSATHKNLAGLVEEGLFRQDLFYRINVIELDGAPAAGRASRTCPCWPNISSAACRRIRMPASQSRARCPGPPDELPASRATCGSWKTSWNGPLPCARATSFAPATCPGCPTGHSRGDADMAPPDVPEGDIDLENYLETIERQTIEKALEATRWNKTAAAKRLGISFRALRYRLKKLGME